MIYACDSCGFLFSRVREVSACPLCSSVRIRPATETEKKTLDANLEKQALINTNSGRNIT